MSRSIETFANGESEHSVQHVSTKQEIIGDAAFVVVPVSRLSTARACISNKAAKVLYMTKRFLRTLHNERKTLQSI